MSADSPVTAYAGQAEWRQVAAGRQDLCLAPYGWPLPKGSTLGQALQKAVQSLMDNGTYDQICKKWGVDSGEIKKSAINDAQS